LFLPAMIDMDHNNQPLFLFLISLMITPNSVTFTSYSSVHLICIQPDSLYI